MQQAAKHNVVIVGCGNLAWHLAKILRQSKFQVSIYNHRKNKALSDFQNKLKCNTFTNLNSIRKDAQYYFICVSDQFIAEVSKKIPKPISEALIVHCSGSMPIKAIKNKMAYKAVIYPVQSFSKQDELQWKEVPFLITASNQVAFKLAKTITAVFSEKAIITTDKERLRIHMAAVMVNNFSNAFYAAAAKNISGNKEAKDFKLLLPLIQQSVKKLDHLNPLQAQTGPAKRGDKAVIKKHLTLLKDQPELKKLYKGMTELIIQQQKLKHA